MLGREGRPEVRRRAEGGTEVMDDPRVGWAGAAGFGGRCGRRAVGDGRELQVKGCRASHAADANEIEDDGGAVKFDDLIQTYERAYHDAVKGIRECSRCGIKEM